MLLLLLLLIMMAIVPCWDVFCQHLGPRSGIGFRRSIVCKAALLDESCLPTVDVGTVGFQARSSLDWYESLTNSSDAHSLCIMRSQSLLVSISLLQQQQQQQRRRRRTKIMMKINQKQNRSSSSTTASSSSSSSS